MAEFFPIREISTYSRVWKIKARVTNRAPVREFTTNTGGGKVFSVDLLDKEGGEIRASFFGAAADKFFEMLQPTKVFTFSRGTVRVSNKRYCNLPHDYELRFEADADIAPCDDDAGDDIKQVQYRFVSLQEVAKMTPPCTVDLCVVVKSFLPAQPIRTKKGADTFKRQLRVADTSSTEMDVTIWAARAQRPDEDFKPGTVLALKGVNIGSWGGHSGSLLENGYMEVNPAVPEAATLSTWFKANGDSQCHNLSGVSPGGVRVAKKAMTLSEMAADCSAGMKEGDRQYYETVARLALVRTTRRDGDYQPLYYMADPETNKKVVDGVDPVSGKAVPNPKPHYNLQGLCFLDHTQAAWISGLGDVGNVLLGKDATHFESLDKQPNGPKLVAEEVENACWARPYKLVVRAQQESYQGESRVKVQLVSAERMGFKELTKRMRDEMAGGKDAAHPESPAAKVLRAA
mmetsp:Transcript_28349/g.68084  ORF Transcript_28349/g.68084 Transcript_28349/m.68084 type:complete len:459 (+) Transcript_28349:74-1450(+)